MNFQLVKYYEVFYQGQPIYYLNDLVVINNFAYINIYMYSIIIKFNLLNGKIENKYDFS